MILYMQLLLYFCLCVQNIWINIFITFQNRPNQSGLLPHPGQSWNPRGSLQRALGWASWELGSLSPPSLWPPDFRSPHWSQAAHLRRKCWKDKLTTTQAPPRWDCLWSQLNQVEPNWKSAHYSTPNIAQLLRAINLRIKVTCKTKKVI